MGARQEDMTVEHLNLVLDGGETFDRLLREGLPEGGDLTVAAKPYATQQHSTAVLLSWTVKLPDGSLARVQAVTTAACFMAAARGLSGYVQRMGS